MMQLIRCWALGDKYDVKNFQDVIMLDLIKSLTIQLVKFWKLNGKLEIPQGHDDSKKMQLVHCWILGDKYDIKEFQDIVVLELLVTLEDSVAPLEVIQLAFKNTAENSLLRKLMARHAVINICESNCERQHLKIFDGVTGFITEPVEAYDIRDEKENGINGLFVIVDGDDEDEWMEFMVVGGPEKHWVHDQ
jgi:hypothetical protein